jgi:hypothetical protein
VSIHVCLRFFITGCFFALPDFVLRGVRGFDSRIEPSVSSAAGLKGRNATHGTGNVYRETVAGIVVSRLEG